MERNLFVLFAYVLPATSILFILIGLFQVTIFFQALSIFVISFMYVAEDTEQKTMFHLKTIVYLGLIGILIILVLLGEGVQYHFIFSMISVAINVSHTNEVRKNRGWPSIIE